MGCSRPRFGRRWDATFCCRSWKKRSSWMAAGSTLSTNFYEPLVIHPEGYRLMSEFRLDPFPVFVFEVDGVEIEKSVFMIHGENSVVIQYQLHNAGGRSVQMEIRPLIAFRDFHV